MFNLTDSFLKSIETTSGHFLKTLLQKSIDFSKLFSEASSIQEKNKSSSSSSELLELSEKKRQVELSAISSYQNYKSAIAKTKASESEKKSSLLALNGIKKESELLISKILEDEFVVACDSMGELTDSGEFSCLLKSCQEMNKTISFIIGGSFGLSQEIKSKADKIFSASLLTFPHRLFRLILVEQIFRAHTIISNMPYHK